MKAIFNILLLLLFVPLIVNGQSEIFTEYHEKNGFCSFSMKLFVDSTYFYESGCEGRSNINFGTWKKSADTILLTPIDTLNFNNSISIASSFSGENNNDLRIKIIDMYDQPIKGFDLIVVPKEIDSKWINHPGKFTFEPNRDTSLVFESKKTDENGFVTVKTYPNCEIKLLDAIQIFTNISDLDCSKFIGKNITIKLNIRKEVFMYPELNWYRTVNYKKINQKQKLIFIENITDKKQSTLD